MIKIQTNNLLFLAPKDALLKTITSSGISFKKAEILTPSTTIVYQINRSPTYLYTKEQALNLYSTGIGISQYELIPRVVLEGAPEGANEYLKYLMGRKTSIVSSNKLFLSELFLLAHSFGCNPEVIDTKLLFANFPNSEIKPSPINDIILTTESYSDTRNLSLLSDEMRMKFIYKLIQDKPENK